MTQSEVAAILETHGYTVTLGAETVSGEQGDDHVFVAPSRETSDWWLYTPMWRWNVWSADKSRIIATAEACHMPCRVPTLDELRMLFEKNGPPAVRAPLRLA